MPQVLQNIHEKVKKNTKSQEWNRRYKKGNNEKFYTKKKKKSKTKIKINEGLNGRIERREERISELKLRQ